MHLIGFFGLPGPVEAVIVGAVALLLFGNRLPSAMRSLGIGIVEFKKGLKGDEEKPEALENKDHKAPSAE